MTREPRKPRKPLNSGQFPLTAATIGARMTRTRTPRETPTAKKLYAAEARAYRELEMQYRDHFPLAFALLDLWRRPDSGKFLRFAANALHSAYARNPSLPPILEEGKA